MVRQGSTVISPQKRLPDQLILTKDGQDLGTENGQVSISLSSDLPGQRRGIFAMQKVAGACLCRWAELTLFSQWTCSGVWRMCHWHSSGLYIPKNATLRDDVGIVDKGAPLQDHLPGAWRRLSCLG